MIPGQYQIQPGDIELNAGRRTLSLTVANSGDRPIQVPQGPRHCRPRTLPAGTAVRFEPGQSREVELVDLAGLRKVYGFAGRVMGEL